MPTSFAFSSNIDKKREREEKKKLEKEKATYNPRVCERELNPYWKSGGDGLPSFKKPTEDEYNKYDHKKKISGGWRKKNNLNENNQSKDEFEEETEENVKILTDAELNILASKLVKAEIMGKESLIKELKEKLENARKLKETSSQAESSIILVETNSTGFSCPVRTKTEIGEYSGSRRKKQKVETHSGGQRVRYFPDDDEQSLKNLFEKEKFNSIEEQNKEFLNLAGKIHKNDDLDDIFADEIRKTSSNEKIEKRNREKAVGEQQKVMKSLDNCNRCIQSNISLKHLLVYMEETVYLSLPNHEPLTEGHCLIAPIRHVSCATQLDENEWSNLIDLRKSLTKMFAQQNEDVIFFEIARFLKSYPHMVIECIPVPKEQGDVAPIYFKKAIDESEMEWSNNKKLILLNGRDVRKAVPKGLPYFSVSFGMQEGFAHVIEEQQYFPENFAQEIIGGMLDLHHSKWRKPKKQSYEEQNKRILKFSKQWRGYKLNSTHN